MNLCRCKALAAIALGSLLFTLPATAAVISGWSIASMTHVGGGIDRISTEGTHVAAVNAGGSPAVVNLDVGTEIIPFEPAPLLANNTNAFNFGPSFGDPALDEILGTHSWQAGGGSFTIGGLTPGTTYQLQILGVNDTRECCMERETLFGDGRGAAFASPPVRRGSSHTVIGTFVADGPTQFIEVLPGVGGGGADPTLSGYILRDLTIPEPGAASLLGLALLGLIVRRRR